MPDRERDDDHVAQRAAEQSAGPATGDGARAASGVRRPRSGEGRHALVDPTEPIEPTADGRRTVGGSAGEAGYGVGSAAHHAARNGDVVGGAQSTAEAQLDDVSTADTSDAVRSQQVGLLIGIVAAGMITGLILLHRIRRHPRTRVPARSRTLSGSFLIGR